MEKFIRTKGSTNFRKGAGTNYEVIQTLIKGTEVEILDTIENTTWYLGRLNDGTVGYITSLAAYVEPFVPNWLYKATALIKDGEKYLGVEYQFGSSRTNSSTFDCSDFVQWVYKETLGITLPWDSRKQSLSGVEIDTSFDTLRTGDLIFFDTNGDGVINHVALYVHDKMLLHTYAVGTGVTYSKYVDGNYWRNKTVSARRIIE